LLTESPMPINPKYLADFYDNGIFHVYNRTNNKELLFRNEENYRFFLKKYSQYLSPFTDTYCWCLLPTHFHFLIRVKSYEAIQEHISSLVPENLTPTEKSFLDQKLFTGELLEKTFKRFFQSYSQSFNKIHNRSGNLFYKPFKRVEIDKESQLTQSIVYIHSNPSKHKIISDFTKYKWSSWHSILSDAPTQLLRTEIIEWFGNKEQFIKAHHDISLYYHECDTAIEE